MLVQATNNRVRIGGSVYGIGGEVHDRTGAVWTLLTAMDGTRTDEELVAHVTGTHPGERADAVRRAIDVFAVSGHVEDTTVPDPPQLSERERERYDRGMRFYRWASMDPTATRWTPQLRLRAARVTVVGVGGTGGSAALALAASGFGAIHCVDRDVVELSNLNRQFLFTEADIGRAKVEVAVERLQAMNSDIRVTGESLSLTGTEDFRPLLAGCDLLVLAADQPGAIRAWANRACLDAQTPWVDAGYHGPIPYATAYLPGHGACYECGWLTEYERHAAAGIAGEYTVERRGSNAVCAPTAGLSGHLAAHLAIAVASRVLPVRSGQTYGLNVLAPDQHFVLSPDRRADCPACGDRP
ncbi:HesA/MoeB/ThiF family protein [Cryptosporangium sp. NPDC051539]|uniref:HesA/MoeB/ThiF family protein n=1 Tax=Cryptosporangium sp. NPDC051539 TaxID=3363962 RepID=UPI0037A85E0D